MTTKLIYPDHGLGAQIVKLLGRPNAPVSRAFLDTMLNKKRDRNLEVQISDTLVWLHLSERICRAYADMGEHEGVTESGVYFWVPEKEFDGWINSERNFEKYHVEQVTYGKEIEESAPPVKTEEPPVSVAPPSANPTWATPSASVASDGVAFGGSPKIASALTLSTDQRILVHAKPGVTFTIDDASTWCPNITIQILKMRVGVLCRKGLIKRDASGRHILAHGITPEGFVAVEYATEVENNVVPKRTARSKGAEELLDILKKDVSAERGAALNVVGAGEYDVELLRKDDPKPAQKPMENRSIQISSDVICRLGSDNVLDIMGADADGNPVQPIRIEGTAFRKMLWFLRSGLTDMSEFK